MLLSTSVQTVSESVNLLLQVYKQIENLLHPVLLLFSSTKKTIFLSNPQYSSSKGAVVQPASYLEEKNNYFYLQKDKL